MAELVRGGAVLDVGAVARPHLGHGADPESRDTRSDRRRPQTETGDV
mgnify:CR=1 FL=1